jgi:radical SAM superfamily enzyme YgiQ (UPF0313 family)
MKRKVLLIEPPYLDLYGKTEAMTKPYFPLGLGYVAASLQKAGHEVRLLLSSAGRSFYQVVMQTVADWQPEIVGFSAMTTNFPRAVHLARRIKQEHHVPIMIGGHHVSALKERILLEHSELDFVVYGEGEDTVLELVEHIDGGSFGHIKGLIWRDGKEVVTNPPRPLRTDLDSLPFPARALVDMSRFSTHSHIAGGKSATILTSRGCPFGCIFCSAHVVDGRKYRPHGVDYVLAEIDALIGRDVQYIFVQDDTFTLQKDRVLQICEAITQRKYPTRFGCFSRTDVMDDQLATALRRAGFENIVFGIESGDTEVLRKIGKRTTVEKSKEAIKACNKAGLKTTASFVIGLPFDTAETIRKTIDLAFELKPTLVAFNPLVPFPGAPVFDGERHTPSTIDGWEKYVTVGVPPYSFVEGYSPEALHRLASRGHRRFYMRPVQVWRILKTVRSATDLKEYFLSAYAGLMT